jgi:hypothetical protein
MWISFNWSAAMHTPSDPSDKPLIIPPKAPAPPPPEKWYPTNTPGVERNSEGKLRTNKPPQSFLDDTDLFDDLPF